jgi:hypothetical protein
MGTKVSNLDSTIQSKEIDRVASKSKFISKGDHNLVIEQQKLDRSSKKNQKEVIIQSKHSTKVSGFNQEYYYIF